MQNEVKGITWAWPVKFINEIRDVYKICVKMPQEKRRLGRRDGTQNDNTVTETQSVRLGD